MENIVYQLFLVLCRPNGLNFTQLIVTMLRHSGSSPGFRRRGGGKNHKGGTFFKYNIERTQQPPRKVACDM